MRFGLTHLTITLLLVIQPITTLMALDNPKSNGWFTKVKTPPQRFLEETATPEETFEPPLTAIRPSKKPIGKYNTEDWSALIDSTWGIGYDSLTDISIGEGFWNIVDTEFACFDGLDPNLWDDIWNQYWPEIEAGGISRGRLCAIIQAACYALQETHTFSWDRYVAQTEPAPGVPILMVGMWKDNSHFGAALTPLEDKSLLVYKTVPSHPLGLWSRLLLFRMLHTYSSFASMLMSLGINVAISMPVSPIYSLSVAYQLVAPTLS